MRLGVALPWWSLLLLMLGALALAWWTYGRSAAPLTARQHLTLRGLRAATLLLLLVCLLRPIRVLPPENTRDQVVPILVDASRSMRLADGGQRPRIDEARDVTRRLQDALHERFHTEVWTFGDALAPAGEQPIDADAGRTDLVGALRAVGERYRGRRVPAVVVVSDGGDTGGTDAAAGLSAADTPVFTIGVGSTESPPDLEVSDVTAGEATYADSSIDLTASVVRRGGDAPFDVRVLENGRPIDLRQVHPAAAGGPVRVVFTVSPPSGAPALYTVEIPVASRERVAENNRRSIIVQPSGRARRILLIEGAPGFEHSFVTRALAADRGLEVDTVVRKGRDAQGQATYFVQAAGARAPQLTSGFPIDREALFAYDAVMLANIEHDDLSRAQLDMLVAFVGERGGGILLLGERSFAERGLAGTVLEDVLPLALSDRGGGIVRAAADAAVFRASVTHDGLAHPVMRISASEEENQRVWSALPALAGAASLGAPRPAAQVLALVRAPDGIRPLVAVQRFGQGRSMIFAGEASWRWRMQLPAADRTFELFWRQTARWLASGSPDPVSIRPLPGIAVGETVPVAIDARTASFAPARDAQVAARVILPGGEERALHPALTDASAGRFTADSAFDKAGVYRIVAEARQGGTRLGESERWLLVGGADPEMVDPRLNDDVLRRVSRATGGEYVDAAQAMRVPPLVSENGVLPGAPRVEELWHRGWLFAAFVALLAVEWTLRRRWGLR